MATLVIDGTIVLAYASATGFRYYHWLMYAHLVNLFTQPLLWCLTGLLPAVVA
jgi:hypothetical protein